MKLVSNVAHINATMLTWLLLVQNASLSELSAAFLKNLAVICIFLSHHIRNVKFQTMYAVELTSFCSKSINTFDTFSFMYVVECLTKVCTLKCQRFIIISYISWYALGILICGCSLFYRRELWASKSVGSNST